MTKANKPFTAKRGEKALREKRLGHLNIDLDKYDIMNKAYEQGKKDAYEKVKRRYRKDTSKEYQWAIGGVNDKWFREHDKFYLWLEELSK